MSASFPSSWEPYGSSQQQHALGWRRTATRPSQTFPRPPATPLPTAAHPAPAARWNQLHRAPPAPTPAAPKPTPSPASEAAALATSLHQHEADTRMLSRFESVRTDVRTVGQRVSKLQARLEEAAERETRRSDAAAADIARLHGLCGALRDDARAEAKERVAALDRSRKREDIRMEDERRRTELAFARLEQRLQDTERRMLEAFESAVERISKEKVSLPGDVDVEGCTCAKANVTPKEKVASREQALTIRKAPPIRKAPTPHDSSSEDSNDLYAIQVANRDRPPPVFSSTDLDSNDVYAMKVANRERPPPRVCSSPDQDSDDLHAMRAPPVYSSSGRNGGSEHVSTGRDRSFQDRRLRPRRKAQPLGEATEGTNLFGDDETLPPSPISKPNAESSSSFCPPGVSSDSDSFLSEEYCRQSRSEALRQKNVSRRSVLGRGASSNAGRRKAVPRRKALQKSGFRQRQRKTNPQEEPPRREIPFSQAPLTRSRAIRDTAKRCRYPA